MRLQAIKPTRAPMGTSGLVARLRAELGAAGFVGDVIHDLANYPPQQLSRGERQSLGRRAGNRLPKRARIGGYRRTGDLGRGWRPKSVRLTGDRVIAEAANKIPYAIHVEGPPDGPKGERQTDEMQRRNWPNIQEVARRRWAQRRPIVVRLLKQNGSRMRIEPL